MKEEMTSKKSLLEEIEKLRLENEELKRVNKNQLLSQITLDEFSSTNENFSFSEASRTRELFEINPNPMWIFDIHTLAFLEVNDAAVEKYGYSREEFLRMTIKDIRPQKDLPKLLKSVSKPNSGLDCAGSWRHRKKDGKIIHVEIVSHTLKFKGKDAELVMANDITERKEAEEALRQSEIRFKGLINSMQDLVYTLDKDQKITGCMVCGRKCMD